MSITQALDRIGATLERIADAIERPELQRRRVVTTREERAIISLARLERPTVNSVSKATGIGHQTLRRLPRFMAALELAQNAGQGPATQE